MTTLQARVDDHLARSARRRARERGTSVSRYLAELVLDDVARAEEAAFWRSFSDYYTDARHVLEAQELAEQFAATLRDGLEDDR